MKFPLAVELLKQSIREAQGWDKRYRRFWNISGAQQAKRIKKLRLELAKLEKLC